MPHHVQHLVDIALRAEHRDQGIGADQEIDPERQDDQQKQQRLPLVGRKADAESDRIGCQQAQCRRQRADPDRLPHDGEIERVKSADVVGDAGEVVILGDRDLSVDQCLVAERHDEQETEWNDEEGEKPHRWWQSQGPEGPRVFFPVLQDARTPPFIFLWFSLAQPCPERQPRPRAAPARGRLRRWQYPRAAW